MRQAARPFVGMRDFRSFVAPDGSAEQGEREKSTVVLVDRVDIVEDGDLVLVVIEGSHFLWKMVRRIVGVLLEIGRGGLEPEATVHLLAGGTEAPARLTAPASGLFLHRVFYANETRDQPVRAQTPVSRT
jgi:tRNA pseudouridine38-40 synthase